MPQIDSSDHHDYFIKDGELIGEFEQMYENIEDPWPIDSLGRRLDMSAALSLLQQFDPRFGRVLDVGCGTGLFTGLLSDLVGGKVWASDISETAVTKARARHAEYGNAILETPQQFLRILEDTGFDVVATLETNRMTNHHLAAFAKIGG